MMLSNMKSIEPNLPAATAMFGYWNRTHYGTTPEQYRAKWDLRYDYPTAAPNYTAAGSKTALAMGFGKQKGPRPPKKST